MEETVPLTDIFLFIATQKALKSKDCLNEIDLAKNNLIDIIPVQGNDILWEDLKLLNLERQKGIPFSNKHRKDDFNDFCLELYDYAKKFKKEMDMVQSKLKKSKISSVDILAIELNMDRERIFKISKVLIKKAKIAGAWTNDMKTFLRKDEIIDRLAILKERENSQKFDEIFKSLGIHSDFHEHVKSYLENETRNKK